MGRALFEAADSPREVLDKLRAAPAHSLTPELLGDPLTAGKLRIVGIYDDRQPGFFMLRIRIPGGRLDWRQAEIIGGVAEELCARPADHADAPERFIEITTRQDIQLHWVQFADLPEIWRRFEAVGLLTLQACGDGARNITSCPVAGLDRHEILDASPVVDALNRFVLDYADASRLPRKFKIAVTGCRDDCVLARINDLAFTPAERDGVLGFHVWAGGGLSDYPRLASFLDAFVTEEQVIDVARGAIDLFHATGNFTDKAVNRFRAVVEQLGPERVRHELAQRTPAGLARAGRDLVERPRFDHVGVHTARRDGEVYVGLAVPVGRMRGAELAALAGLARRYGDGGLRLTQRQNLILTGIEERRVETLLGEPQLERFSPHPSAAMRSVVACTSAPFCKFGLVDAKSTGLAIADDLSELLNSADPDLRIHVSGCKASCAQTQIADIGLRGTLAKEEDGYRVAFDIALGGNLAQGHLAPWAALAVPAETARQGIRRLVAWYRAAREDGEAFSEFIDRVGLDRATVLLREDAR